MATHHCESHEWLLVASLLAVAHGHSPMITLALALALALALTLTLAYLRKLMATHP